MVGKDENSALISLPTEQVGPCKFDGEKYSKEMLFWSTLQVKLVLC